MEEVAAKIRAMRQEGGWTQEEFPRELGVTISSVVRWENGHGKPSKLAKEAIKKVMREYRTRIMEHGKKYEEEW